MTAGSGAERFNSEIVQVGRGLAAVAVLLFHTAGMFAEAKYGGRDLWNGWGELGQRGVDFFFVLSGFIILTAHRSDIGARSRFGRYWNRRFTRIYPVYWIYLTGFLMAAFLGFANSEIATRPVDLLSAYSLVLLSPEHPPIWAAWTLFHEMLFYALFSVLLVSRRLGLAVLGVWLVAILVFGAPNGATRPTMQTLLLDTFNLQFFFGMAVALVVPRITRTPAVACAFSGGVMLCGAFALTRLGHSGALAIWAYGLSFAVLLTGLVGLERLKVISYTGPLKKLGDATFTFYLVHVAILSVVMRFAHDKFDFLGPAMWLAPLIVAAVVLPISMAVWWLVERPLLIAMRDGPRVLLDRRRFRSARAGHPS